MSKKFLYLVGILLTIVVGTLLFWYYCCDCGAKNRNTETVVAVADPIVPEEPVSNQVSPEAVPAPSVDWGAVRAKLNDHPLMLNFQAYQTESVLQEDHLNKLEEIIEYLSNNPDDGLLITGHADISGPRTLNMKLSQERADFLRGYLVQQGIDAGKIIASSKGPDDPIADNNTAEGRAKNRRAVVFIK